MSNEAKTAKEAIEKTRIKMVMDLPWFGALAHRLKLAANENIDTMCVDGVTIEFNPAFTLSLTSAERLFVIAHEVLHCAMLHMSRRGGRDAEMWNEACDYVINLILRDAGFTAPEDVLLDDKYKGLGAEQVYARLAQQQAKKSKANPQNSTGKSGQGQPGKGAIGQVKDAPKTTGEAKGGAGDKPTEAKAQPQGTQDVEFQWQQAVEEATMIAKKAGTLPGFAGEVLGVVRASETDYRDVLQRYLTTMGDYSWTRPNRRHISSGLYLPGTIKTKLGCMIIIVDTSGSTRPICKPFAAEINSIMQHEEKPETALVIYIDTAVRKTVEIDGELNFEYVGGGGTYFQPAFNYIQDMGLEPDVAFFLTDMECGDVPQDPGYPVVWVTNEGARKTVEFGEMVRIPMSECRG